LKFHAITEETAKTSYWLAYTSLVHPVQYINWRRIVSNRSVAVIL